MQISLFVALFLPCAGMTAVFIVYLCLLWYDDAAGNNNNQEFQSPPAKPRHEGGLSACDLEKLPKVTGKDLVLAGDCPVCLDEIGSEQQARMVPGCNHGFHLKCADAWLSKNPVCPICRARLGPELFNLTSERNPC